MRSNICRNSSLQAVCDAPRSRDYALCSYHGLQSMLGSLWAENIKPFLRGTKSDSCGRKCISLSSELDIIHNNIRTGILCASASMILCISQIIPLGIVPKVLIYVSFDKKSKLSSRTKFGTSINICARSVIILVGWDGAKRETPGLHQCDQKCPEFMHYCGCPTLGWSTLVRGGGVLMR